MNSKHYTKKDLNKVITNKTFQKWGVSSLEFANGKEINKFYVAKNIRNNIIELSDNFKDCGISTIEKLYENLEDGPIFVIFNGVSYQVQNHYVSMDHYTELIFS